MPMPAGAGGRIGGRRSGRRRGRGRRARQGRAAPKAGAEKDAMKLSEVSIQRPVFATVMSLAILLFGVIAFSRLPVREYPDIDPPIVSVTTFYRGASPQRRRDRDHRRPRGAVRDPRGGQDASPPPAAEQGSVITIEFELQPQRRRGGQRRARPRLARPRPAPARGRRPDRLQGGRQRPADRLARALQRPPHRARAVRRRRPRPEGAAPAPRRASARCSSAASAATRCASGSTRSAWPPTA